MRRLIKIILLHLELVFEHRSVSFIWFIVVMFNALSYLLFWRGALGSQTTAIQGGSLQEAFSYYLLLVVVGTFIMAHIEEEVAYEDIQRGRLAVYLTKPFSYFFQKLFLDVPWRLIQSMFGIMALIIAIYIFRIPVQTVSSLPIFSAALALALLGYMLSFVFKMVIGLSALWITEFTGLSQLFAVIILVFGGYIIPLDFFPMGLREFALGTPFAYMVYYPLVALQGRLPPADIIRVGMGQLAWLGLFLWVYHRLWFSGVRKFTAVGR